MIVTFKSLEIKDFKGIESMKFDFGNVTKITGANETGKTTVADAISYCLTGKSSFGEKFFEILPVGKEGVSPTVKLEIEMDDGENKRYASLSRVYQAKYSRDKKFTGTYSTVCYINDAKCTVKEMDAWVESHICDSEIFRLVHDVRYFTENITTSGRELAWEAQRRLLMSICPVKTDLQIAGEDDKWDEIAEQLKRYDTASDLLTALKQKYSALQKELDDMSVRIDSLEDCKKDCDISIEEAEERKLFIKSRMDKLEEENEQYRASQKSDKVESLKAEIDSVKKQIEEINAYNMKAANDFISRRAKLAVEIDKKRDRLSDISLKVKKFVDSEGRIKEQAKSIKKVCPTCGQSIQKDKVDEQIESLRKKYKEVYDERKKAEKELSKAQEDFEEENIKMEKFAAGPEVQDNSELMNRLNELFSEMNDVSVKDLDSYAEDKEKLQTEYEEAEAVYQDAKFNQEMEDKIVSLENDRKETIQSKANTQRMLDICREFITYKCDLVENKLNKMFGGVQFKMFRQNKTNDEIKECCDIFWNGVPYSALSYSTKFIVSMKIAQAFQDYYNVHIPLMVDNAESIDFDSFIDGQVILMEKKPQLCSCGGNTGRRDPDGLWTCQKCGKRFKKTLEVIAG